MQETSLDNFHEEILKILFLDDELTVYEIEKKCGLPHATAYKKTHELLRMGLIEIKKEEIFRTGLKMKSFGLTNKGIFVALKYVNFKDERVKSKLDELAKRSPPIHPLLPLWPFFRQNSLEDFFKNMLVNFETAFPVLLISLLQQEETPLPFEYGEFKPIKVLNNEQQRRLINEIKKNEDLYRKILTQVELNIKKDELELQNLKKLRELLLTV